MGKLKGHIFYNRFLEGIKLSPRQTIIAQCYICNGELEGHFEDCRGESCPLYPYFKKWVYRVRKGKNVDSTSGVGHFAQQ